MQVWIEAMQERIDEFKTKGKDGSGKDDHGADKGEQDAADGKVQPVSEEELEASATKKVEDLTKLLEVSSNDEELSIDEATDDVEATDSKMVKKDIEHIESLAKRLDTRLKDWSETKVQHSTEEKLNLKRNTRETECKLCHFKVAQAGNLKRHMRKKHKHEDWQQQPSNENSHFKDQQTPETTSDDSLVFFCDFCNLAFTSEDSLSGHIKNNHSERETDKSEDVQEDDEKDGITNKDSRSPRSDEKFMKKCDLCPKMLKRSTYDWKIQFHMRRAHGKHETEKKARIAQCKLCYREYKGNAGKKNLRRHEENAHKDELGLLDMDAALRWPCTVCELKFISNNVLDVHMNFAHRQTDVEQMELLSKDGAVVDEVEVDEVEMGTDMDIDMEKLYPEMLSAEFVCCKKDFVSLKKLKKHKSNVHGTTTFVGRS